MGIFSLLPRRGRAEADDIIHSKMDGKVCALSDGSLGCGGRANCYEPRIVRQMCQGEAVRPGGINRIEEARNGETVAESKHHC